MSHAGALSKIKAFSDDLSGPIEEAISIGKDPSALIRKAKMVMNGTSDDRVRTGTPPPDACFCVDILPSGKVRTTWIL